MAQQSSLHFYANWAKERIDEMEAALASLEAKAGGAQTETRKKTDQFVADLKKRRDEFQASVKKQADSGEAAWAHIRPDLESQWNGFEAQVKTYFETVGKEIGHQQATFRDVAAAQVKAWRETADKLRGASAKAGATQRSEIDAAIAQMKASASEAEARLQKAGTQSWATLSGALAETRQSFDHATRTVWETLKRALPPAA